MLQKPFWFFAGCLVIVLMGAIIILGISVPVVDRVMDSYLKVDITVGIGGMIRQSTPYH